jgi:hypothetical protein
MPIAQSNLIRAALSRNLGSCSSRRRLCSAKSRGDRFKPILMMEAGENRCRGDTVRTGNLVIAQPGGDGRRRIGNAGAESRVWTNAIVMSHPLGQDSAEMLVVERNHIIETLTT